jgi:hypothetical protein
MGANELRIFADSLQFPPPFSWLPVKGKAGLWCDEG